MPDLGPIVRASERRDIVVIVEILRHPPSIGTIAIVVHIERRRLPIARGGEVKADNEDVIDSRSGGMPPAPHPIDPRLDLPGKCRQEDILECLSDEALQHAHSIPRIANATSS
jgi:hypothetical protein